MNALTTTPLTALEYAGQATVSKETLRAARNVALFVAAPFVGLAYLIAFPFVGLGMLAWMGYQSLTRNHAAAARLLKHVAMVLAAPIVGLVAVVVFPIAGLVMLAWMAVQARTTR